MIQPVKKIDLPDWARVQNARDVMCALGAEDKDFPARFVGGCVRNLFFDGAAVGDIDIATVYTPDAVTDKLAAAGIKSIPTGISHGTVTAVMPDGQHFEITTLRRDVETHGRHAVVAYGADWREDAMRRDFTMNTLLLDMDGNVYDPTGRGLADIQARRVVFVGDADARVREDILRILRFFRFHGTYARGAADADALAACGAHAGQIVQLSRERITQEFLKILSLDAPDGVFALMAAQGVMADIFTAAASDMFTALCDVQNRYGALSVPARLYVLSGMDRVRVTDWEDKYFLLPKSFRTDIARMHEILNSADIDIRTERGLRRAMYLFGKTAATQALLIRGSEQGHLAGEAHVRDGLRTIQAWDIPVFPVTGADLMAQGMTPGKALGDTLRRMERDWIDSDFTAI